MHTPLLQVKGFQVAPAELEGCLLEHDDVNNTCVVGVPDEFSEPLCGDTVYLTDWRWRW